MSEKTEHLTCNRCGKEYDLDNYVSLNPVVAKMRREGLCHHCAFWSKFIDEHGAKMEVVDGIMYESGDQLFISSSKLLPVKTRYILRYDLKALRMPSARSIGKVTKTYPIANTGKFITRDQYKKLTGTESFECRAIGCYDRYHCHWYHKELHEQDGPWNVVPKSHVIGSERCPNFINTRQILSK